MMNELSVSGLQFAASPNTIRVFLFSMSQKGKKWIVDGQGEVLLDSNIARIESPIQQDQSEGRGHLIDHLLVPPQFFSALFLSGFITLDHLRQAVEDEVAQTITISGVLLRGHEFRVRTMPESLIIEKYGTSFISATIDTDGNIV